MIILKVVEFIFVFALGLVFAIFFLFASRSIICDDIRKKRGRHELRNHPKLKDGVWKWFFLTERIEHMVYWRYVFFIIDSVLSVIIVLIMAIAIVFGNNKFLQEALRYTLIPDVFLKAIPSMIPWGRYRN